MSGLPRGWSSVMLEKLCDFIMGQAPPGSDCNRTGDGTAFVKAGEFGIDRPVIREWTTRPLKQALAGDVLICVVGATAGKINLGADCAIGRSVAAIRPSDVLDQHFLYKFLSTKVLELRSGSVGSAQGVISKENLAKVDIGLPPLPEQRRIVAKIDNLTAKSRRAREHLDRIPRLVEKYKQAVLAAAFNSSEIAGWKEVQFEAVVEDALIGLVRSKVEQSATHGLPYIRMHHFDIDGRWNERDLSLVEADSREAARYELREGDLLFNTRNSFELVGKVALWSDRPQGYLYNNNLLRIRLKPEIVPAFAFYQMISPQFRTYLHSVKSATTSVCAIYQRSIMAAPWAYPDPPRQQLIAKRIETAFAWVDRLAAEASSARKLVDHLDQAVLAKAFRGELVPQDPADEPASALLERIRIERAEAPRTGRARKSVAR